MTSRPVDVVERGHAMNTLPRLLWVWMLLLLLACHARAQAPFKPVPPLRTRVTDEVGMLTPDQRQQLESALAYYETKTGSQIAVLIVASTEPEAIEQYGIRVADAWKPGRVGIDDGVLLIVAKDNPKALRRLRIEAGRGVQGVLTDAQSKRILQDAIAPYFRQQDWYGGVHAGVGAIAVLLDQASFMAPRRHTRSEMAGYIVLAFFAVAGLIVIIVAYIAIRADRRFRRTSRPARRAPRDTTYVDSAPAFAFGNNDSSSSDRSSDFSGDGGSFDGGGASGDWSD
jgi:uncharacterized protein